MTSGPELPPRPELPIGHPEFDAFLSASIGEDADGIGVTVMSALARLGLDPWSEAARLSDLPREAAVEALVLTLGRLPAGSWQRASSEGGFGELARRLADCLPRTHRPVSEPGQSGPQAKSKAMSGPLLWLFYAAAAVGFYLLLSQLQPERQFEPASRESTQQ